MSNFTVGKRQYHQSRHGIACTAKIMNNGIVVAILHDQPEQIVAKVDVLADKHLLDEAALNWNMLPQWATKHPSSARSEFCRNLVALEEAKENN